MREGEDRGHTGNRDAAPMLAQYTAVAATLLRF